MSSGLLTSVFCAAVIIFISCDKDEAFIPGPNQIDLQAPQAGQENYYVMYNGLCGELEPTGDTLILRIKEFDGTQLQLEERWTAGSPLYIHNTESFIYPAQWSTSFLDIKPEHREGSKLFFFYGSDTLRLVQPPALTLYQNNCVVWNGQEGFTGDFIGAVPRFRVGSESYSQKKVVSCVPVILDIDAYLVYDNRNLYSSFRSFTGGFIEIETTITAYALISR
jgi:hypothetical protein